MDGGRPRALIPGKGVREGLGKAGWVPTRAGLVDGGSRGARGVCFWPGGRGGPRAWKVARALVPGG